VRLFADRLAAPVGSAVERKRVGAFQGRGACCLPGGKEAEPVSKRLSALTGKWLLYAVALLLALPMTVFVPQRQAAGASRAGVQTLLHTIKEINYYPEHDAWTNMWMRFHPREIDHDFANIQGVGFNTVRIILQANPGVFDYPVPTAAQLQKLAQVVQLSASHHLKVHLTLFDDWDQYTDLAGSQQWADAIVKPYAADPRISLIEVQNEMDLSAPGSLRWAQTMIPYVQRIDGAIPVTISESGLSHMQRLVQALRKAPPDVYEFHDYEYDGQIYQTLQHVKALLQGAPLLVGETGYSTYPQSSQGFSGTAHNTLAQEAQQEYYYRMFVFAIKGVGLPFPAPWIYRDFSDAAFPHPPQPGTLFEAYFGLFRLDGSHKPAAQTIARLLAGHGVQTSFNNGFEQGDGQGLPTLWRMAQNAAQGVRADFAQDRTVAHSGHASATIAHSTASPHGTASFFLTPIQYVIPGRTYTISVWAKGLQATGRDYLSMAWFDATGHLFAQDDSPPFLKGTYTWQQRTLIARAPSQAAGMEIHLNSAGNTGTVWFDDVSLI
jgi:hypothetical protein